MYIYFKKQCLYFVFSSIVLGLISCSSNNTTIDNSVEKYFTESDVKGCFGLWDNGQNQLTIYNLERFRDSSYQPATTFHIIHSLIALHTGRIFSDSVNIRCDAIAHSITPGNTGMRMKEAFQMNCDPCYQVVARAIGKDTMQIWTDSLQYGTKKINTDIDTFWLDNSLKITADEQLGLMKKLYFKQLVFNSRSQEIVRSMMLKENNANYKLSYQTGHGTLVNGALIGWTVGWIEENNHVYFFSMNCESKNTNAKMDSISLSITKKTLKQFGFFEGKK